MQWSDIQFNPSEKTLRQFAGLFLIIFGLLALVEVAVPSSPATGARLRGVGARRSVRSVCCAAC